MVLETIYTENFSSLVCTIQWAIYGQKKGGSGRQAAMFVCIYVGLPSSVLRHSDIQMQSDYSTRLSCQVVAHLEGIAMDWMEWYDGME